MTTRTKTKPREETIAQENARMGSARGRSGRNRVDDDTLRATRSLLRECFGQAVDGIDLTRLTHGEAGELAVLTRSIHVEQKASPSDYFESAETVEGFALRAETLAAEGGWPDLRNRGALLAEFARTRQRTPTDSERDAIMRAKVSDTLATVHLPEPGPQTISRGFHLGELDADARARFEALIEKACDQEPGGIFEKERERRRFGAKLAELAARTAPGPRKRTRPALEQPGTIVLPGLVIEHVLETTGETASLTVASLAVLTLVVGLIESRRLPAMCTHYGTARFKDDGTTIVVRKDQNLFGTANPDERVGVGAWQEALGDLARMRWLTVEPAGQWQKISYGPRMQDFLRGREEVS